MGGWLGLGGLSLGTGGVVGGEGEREGGRRVSRVRLAC